jgi:aminoglycoside phosphotransferase (APT) family kinase protein
VTHPMCASLNERWAELRPGKPLLRSALVAGPDKDSSSKVTLILFDQEGRAAAVAKVSRDETGERALIREDDVLRRFRSAGVPTVQRDAPEPLVLRRVGRQLALVMSAIDGEPLLTRYYSPGHSSDPRRVTRDFLSAGDWLARFQTETTRGREQCSSASIAARIDPVIDSYRKEIGWSPEEEDLFAAVRARAATLDEAWVPITGVHGDFWFGNLLMAGTQVGGVVDWELGVTEGLPFSDIYKFPTSYGFYLDRAYPPGTRTIPGHGGRETIDARWARNGQWRNLPGFVYTYFGEGWFPDLVRRFILGHLERLGVPPEVNGVFFPLFLAQQAMALRDPVFRSGYRSLVVGFSRERASTWLWTHGVPSSPERPSAALEALAWPSGGKGRRSA